MDGKCVNAAFDLAGKRLVDQPVTLQARHAFEDFRHYIDPEMRLAARPVPGMTLMLARFINDRQALRRESFGQLLCDEVGGPHGVRLKDGTRAGQCALSSLEGAAGKGA